MSELTLTFDRKIDQSMDGLMKRFGAKNKAELIAKAIAILKIASHVEETPRKDGKETKIKVS